MSRTNYNAFQRQLAQQAGNDPRLADRISMQRFGMPYAEVENSLQCVMALLDGKIPTGAAMKWAEQSTAQQFGWGPDRVSSEMRRIIDLPTPQQRVYGYLTAGGQSVTEEAFSNVMDFVQTGQSQAMQRSLDARVSEGADFRDNKVTGGMPATKRVLESSQDRQHLRDSLNSQLGGLGDQATFQQRAQAVQRAREQLADRIDAQQGRDYIDRINGKEPQEKSLREQLADDYDTAKVRAVSIEYGFGDPVSDAGHVVDEVSHLEDDADITEQLRNL